MALISSPTISVQPQCELKQCLCVSGECCGCSIDVDWRISIYSPVRSCVCVSFPPFVCVFRALWLCVCVICVTVTYKDSQAQFFPEPNPSLFDSCFSNIPPLSPFFLCFPSLLALVSSPRQYVRGLRVQGHSFPSLKLGLFPPFPLTLSKL